MFSFNKAINKATEITTPRDFNLYRRVVTPVFILRETVDWDKPHFSAISTVVNPLKNLSIRISRNCSSSLSSSSSMKTDISFHVALSCLCRRFHPERGRQPELSKDGLHLLDRSTSVVWRHSIVIPKLGQGPDLIEGQHLASLNVIARTPGINSLFRPEEQHRRSSIDQVVIPVGEG